MNSFKAERFALLDENTYDLSVLILHRVGLIAFLRFKWRKHLFVRTLKSVAKRYMLGNTDAMNQELVKEVELAQHVFEKELESIIGPEPL
jgi:hypothetical protein